MRKKIPYHIYLKDNGTWSVKGDGAKRSLKIFFKKREALRFAKKLSIKRKVDLYLYSKDGKVKKKYTYSENRSLFEAIRDWWGGWV